MFFNTKVEEKISPDYKVCGVKNLPCIISKVKYLVYTQAELWAYYFVHVWVTRTALTLAPPDFAPLARDAR